MKGVELRAGEKVIHLSEGYYVHHGGVLVRKLRDEELIEVERNAQPDNQEANTGAGDHQGLGSVLVSLSHERSQLEQTARQALNTHGGDVQRSADSAFETASKNVDQPAGVHSTVENTQPTSHGSDNVANVAMTDATPHPTHRTVGGLNVAQPSNFSVQSKKQTYYLPQGLLSKDYFTHIDSTAYNPLWIQDNNINPEVLAGFRSKIKMESMFGRGVFEIGDQFHLIGPRGIVCTAKEAIVSPCNTLQPWPFYLTIKRCSISLPRWRHSQISASTQSQLARAIP